MDINEYKDKIRHILSIILAIYLKLDKADSDKD